MKKILFLFFFFLSPLLIDAQAVTLSKMMSWLHRQYNINFVYSSEVNVNKAYHGNPLNKESLKTSLNMLFGDTGITWTITGRNVILKVMPSKKKKKTAVFTLSGSVMTPDKEPIINASLFDIDTRQGILTNEHGYFYMPLTEGKHTIRISYVAYKDIYLHLNIHKDLSKSIVLNENGMTIKEIVVNADARSPLLSTQTGKRTLTASDINTEFALLSSPDIVKVLQQSSGVASGVEGASGLYVHGGENDENLFLLDNSPLYNINHSLGLFSSFNSDIIKNVDFYKSGFPARYGGRVSSVTDIRTREGDLEKTKGTFSMGLLDGRIQLEGPIVKGFTSYNVALRRSWLDLISTPIFAIVNKGKDDKYKIGYLFYDFNVKITHHLNDHSLIWLSFYSGHDHYKIRDKDIDDNYYVTYTSDVNNDFKWGNMNATLNFSNRFSKRLSGDISAIYTQSKSTNGYGDEEYYTQDDINHRTSMDLQYNKSRLYDIGLKTDFDWHPDNFHHLKFGADYTLHSFHPQTNMQAFYYGDNVVDTTLIASSSQIKSCEIAFYAEDEMHLLPALSANVGARSSLFMVRGRHYYDLDPRIAVKYQLNDNMAFKFSYTMMSQYVHRIASTYLDMPTDYWVPITENIKPMYSRQTAGGVYFQPNSEFLFTLEGFFKRTYHQLQYRDWMGLQPAADRWEKDVMDGEGKSYGMETDARYSNARFMLSASYTLSWSKRFFNEIGRYWFNDKFDNRHKIYLTGRWNISPQTSMYASWQYHSGNRITLPSQYVNLPDIPGDDSHEDAGYIYGKPNNYNVPAYHRLDIGFNFTHRTHKGYIGIWNLSIYNAYCHLNTMYVKLRRDDEGKIQARCRGYVPIIPSISYTLKF